MSVQRPAGYDELLRLLSPRVRLIVDECRLRPVEITVTQRLGIRRRHAEAATHLNDTWTRLGKVMCCGNGVNMSFRAWCSHIS